MSPSKMLYTSNPWGGIPWMMNQMNVLAKAFYTTQRYSKHTCQSLMRCPECNGVIAGVVPFGNHIYGRAVDLAETNGLNTRDYRLAASILLDCPPSMISFSGVPHDARDGLSLTPENAYYKHAGSGDPYCVNHYFYNPEFDNLDPNISVPAPGSREISSIQGCLTSIEAMPAYNSDGVLSYWGHLNCYPPILQKFGDGADGKDHGRMLPGCTISP